MNWCCWCCFYNRSRLSYNEAITLLENSKNNRAVLHSSREIVAAARNNPLLSAAILANTDYRTLLKPHNIAKILAAPNNRSLAIEMVDPDHPNLAALQEFQLHHLLTITRAHPEFMLKLLDINELPIFKALNLSNKAALIPEFVCLDPRICQKLITEHATIFAQLSDTHLKTLAEKNPEFGHWFVNQEALMAKLRRHSQQKLHAQYPETDQMLNELQPLLKK